MAAIYAKTFAAATAPGLRARLRKNVTGWVIGPGDVYWNGKKDGD